VGCRVVPGTGLREGQNQVVPVLDTVSGTCGRMEGGPPIPWVPRQVPKGWGTHPPAPGAVTSEEMDPASLLSRALLPPAEQMVVVPLPEMPGRLVLFL
jgi:hypothetical protein